MLGIYFVGLTIQFNNLLGMVESGQAFLFLWNELGSQLHYKGKKNVCCETSPVENQ